MISLVSGETKQNKGTNKTETHRYREQTGGHHVGWNGGGCGGEKGEVGEGDYEV